MRPRARFHLPLCRTLLSVCGAALLAAVTIAAAARLCNAQVTDAEVRQCVAQAAAKLKSAQKTDGHWETVSNRYGGMTALAVLALVNAGEPLDDPVVAKGLKALEAVPDSETYVVSLRLMAFVKAEQVSGQQRYRRQIEQAVRWLAGAQSSIGTWGYDARWAEGGETREAVATSTDNSNTQMALLALYEAARAGYKVDDPVWKKSEDYFVRTQLADGGWGYRHEGQNSAFKWPSYGSMTAAGLASLMITGARLHVAEDCGCKDTSAPRYRQNQPIAQGLSWLAKNFAVEKNPGLLGNTWHFYYLYAVERVGIISGLQHLGQHDWFREGAEYLVRHQTAEGSFSRSADRGGVAPDYDTAFALLFLAKGHVPALAAKLRWSDKNSEWNWNIYDLDNLTRWIGPKLNGGPLGWQTVSFTDRLEEWLKAPLLIISGLKAPKFSPSQKARLRKYVEQGGTILADACCASKEFTEAMRQLAQEVFPESPLEPLPQDHPVYSSYEKLSPHWPLEGLTFGCRTNFLISATDLSCAWELSHKAESLLGLKMGLNIAAYATARQPLPERLAAVKLIGELPKVNVERMGLFVGKVRTHDRDWNSRPLATTRLLELLRTQSGVQTADRAVPVDLTDEQLFRFPIIYLSGHRDPALTAQEKQGLKRYLERGGFLFAEACCGMKEFDVRFRALMAELFPGVPLEPLPPDSPLFSGAVGYRMDKVAYAPAVQQEEPRLSAPQLWGLKLADRYGVIYSPYAVAAGLDGIATFHARGYAAEDARRIAVNVMLYGLKY